MAGMYSLWFDTDEMTFILANFSSFRLDLRLLLLQRETKGNKMAAKPFCFPLVV